MRHCRQRAAQMEKYQLLRGTNASLSMLNFEFDLCAACCEKSNTERYKRVAVHAKILFSAYASRVTKTITERYKRVAAHAKMFSPQVEASITTMSCTR